MDFTVNNYNTQSPTFGAKLSRVTRKAIRNGIKSEFHRISQVDKKVGEKRLAERNNLFNKINSYLEELEDGTVSIYNQLGLNPQATKIDITTKNRYSAFVLPEEIQKEIKIVDKSNIFRDKYVVSEFPANRLNWLLNFVENVIS